MSFIFAIKSNRLASVEKGSWSQVKALDIPEDGLLVRLKDFGIVKLFRTYLKDPQRHYIIFHPDEHAKSAFKNIDFKRIYDQYWDRNGSPMLKQVRKARAMRNYFLWLCGLSSSKK